MILVALKKKSQWIINSQHYFHDTGIEGYMFFCCFFMCFSDEKIENWLVLDVLCGDLE